MDWRSIKRHQSPPYSLNKLEMDWSIDFPAFLSVEIIRNSERVLFLSLRNKTILVSRQPCFWRRTFFFCLCSGCTDASGWHRRSPMGNIKLVSWSLGAFLGLAQWKQSDGRGTKGLSARGGGGGGGAGPGVSSSDKLLFTVQIYDSFYVPNRKALRYIGGNGAVGNTPGDWQIRPTPPLLSWSSGRAGGLLYLAQHTSIFRLKG